jgi:hypothetical protein
VVIANHPWTASAKGRRRSLVRSKKKKKREGPDAVRRRLHSRNYETDGIYRKNGRSTNTGCQNAPTSINSAVMQTARRLATEVRRGTRQIKDSMAEKKEKWQGERMHGQLPRYLDGKLVDIEQSYRLLKSVDIKGETKYNIGSSRPSS